MKTAFHILTLALASVSLAASIVVADKTGMIDFGDSKTVAVVCEKRDGSKIFYNDISSIGAPMGQDGPLPEDITGQIFAPSRFQRCAEI